jgi:hypothetical protein
LNEDDALDSDFLSQCSDPIAEYSDRGSADAIAGILNGEGVHTEVEAHGLVAGLPAGYRILVDPRQLHRARWVLRESNLTDGELAYLATGKLDPQPDE